VSDLRGGGWPSLGLQAVTLAAIGAGLGVGLGMLAGVFWTAGLFVLLAGLGLGGAAVFLGRLGGRPVLAPGVWLAVALAWTGWQALEDAHQRRAFREDVARSRAADNDLPPNALETVFDGSEADYMAFLAQGSEALLEAECLRLYGQGGPVGRWMLRHDGGLRLVSLGRRALGLPVPWPVSAAVTLAELLLAALVARRVLRVA
jgi:hypothetical protein